MGRQALKPAHLDMAALARSVFEELQAQAAKRRIELHLTAVPPAMADAAMLRQLMTNLISNAIKYSVGREVASVHISGGPDKTGLNVYSVRDNGVGFDATYAHKLFKVFQRLHSAEEFEGTGVGLALVRRIVERHGGRVWADSKLGEGAAFHFTLPASEA